MIDLSILSGPRNVKPSQLPGSISRGAVFPLPGCKPVEFLEKQAYTSFDGKKAAAPLQHLHGTTTLGFVYQGGVLIAVDSRSTRGAFVGSQEVKKIINISPSIVGTMAGGAADCQFWESNLAVQCRLMQLREREEVSVAAASKLLANTLYKYRSMGLSVGTMIAGWDKLGPALFYVDNEGRRLKGNVFSVGSGSTYAYGILDRGYRYDLTKEEAIELGRRAIYHATHRDAGSGGIVNCVTIDEAGAEWHDPVDCYDLHYGSPEAPVDAGQSVLANPAE
ncbi:peptidase T1A, proteasome beta-subunit [Kipferlia bialata]|uniref:Proteasome subunit beta n=1 Tax=Kipferlia bialata TaxID=797122 RepID=A0A391NM60_9EUKA|nr:peptidase T1A, proteasome beta-subunit [Kipferlia bialata]|eukprot:g6094.t1